MTKQEIIEAVPDGYVYLGKGGEFAIPSARFFFKGAMLSYFNKWLLHDEVSGDAKDFHYAAPCDSDIAKLNGLSNGGPENDTELAKLKRRLEYYEKITDIYETELTFYRNEIKKTTKERIEMKIIYKNQSKEPLRFDELIANQFFMCKGKLWQKVNSNTAICIMRNGSPCADYDDTWWHEDEIDCALTRSEAGKIISGCDTQEGKLTFEDVNPNQFFVMRGSLWQKDDFESGHRITASDGVPYCSSADFDGTEPIDRILPEVERIEY